MQSVHQNFIKHKLGLLNLAAELGNVSKACKMMGLSRDTFIAIKPRSKVVVLKHYSIKAGASPISKIVSTRLRNHACSLMR